MTSDDNTYSLKISAFGGQINWKGKDLLSSSATAINAISIKPKEELIANYTSKNPKSFSVSNIPEKSAHEVNTEKNPTKTITFSHVEGGWPERVVADPEPEKVAREKKNWVREREKGTNFYKIITNLTTSAEIIFKQNQLMDVYEEYFDNVEETSINDNFEAKVEMVYKDIEPYKRSVRKVVWNIPEDKEEQKKIAVAYHLDKTINQDIPPDYLPPALVWDIDKPNEPTNVLKCSSEIVTLAFNNKHSNIVGVGLANGTAGFFNLKNNKAVGFTKVENSHTEPVTEFLWLKSKNLTEFVTCSTDGSIRWWEIKDKECLILLEGYTTPVEIVPLCTHLFLTNKEVIGDKEITKEYGGTKIDNTSDAGPNKFLVATEQGVIFVVNKKKTEGDIAQKLGLNGGNHLGPIVGMQRNPSSFKFILTVGDWTVRIWTEDLRTPIFISKYHPAYLSDCLWTPRVGMFLISRSDGLINGYDLCYKLNEPCFSYKVTDAALTTMAISMRGDKLLVGDEEGKVSLVKLSESFYVQPNKDDLEVKKNNLGKFFDNEQAKEKLLTTVKKVPMKKENVVNKEKLEKEKQQRIDDITNEYLNYISVITGKKVGDEENAEEEEKHLDEDIKKSPQKENKEEVAEKTVEVNNNELHDEDINDNELKQMQQQEDNKQTVESKQIDQKVEAKDDNLLKSNDNPELENKPNEKPNEEIKSNDYPEVENKQIEKPNEETPEIDNKQNATPNKEEDIKQSPVKQVEDNKQEDIKQTPEDGHQEESIKEGELNADNNKDLNKENEPNQNDRNQHREDSINEEELKQNDRNQHREDSINEEELKQNNVDQQANNNKADDMDEEL